MSRSDYYRPSQGQIRHHYKCPICRREVEVTSDHVSPYHCGEPMDFAGESYPASVEDWEEERYPNGSWGKRRY